YAHRKYMLWSAIAFLAAVAVGVVSTIMEPDFTRTILGDSYVNMTLENIERGDPLAVYKQMESGDMFGRIAVNNIRVALLMYIVGIFAGIPTILLLLTNGVMVGTFLQYFIAQDLGWTAFSTIFLHGSLELSAIVIVGGCGLLLGSCALFPGTYSRSFALVRGAKDSLKLVLGIAPFIVLAALIEGYVTRLYQDMSGGVRLLIILGSLSGLIWYAFIYPTRFRSHDRTTL
ncbi:MAG: stage II sporulation protein M, partial [Saprospiraceae bacterium]|nr:stage II sporulation protein M [Saprospiraceae bacterium]